MGVFCIANYFYPNNKGFQAKFKNERRRKNVRMNS